MDSGGTIGKRYSVVKFVIDNSYSEIPTAWLILDDNQQQKCWWPRTANAAPLIANYASPNFETWDQYNIELIKHCRSLESARKSAADSNYQTTDEDKLGRGKRQHTLYNRYSSEEEENDDYVHRPIAKIKKKEKASSMNKITSAFPLCPDNLTLNNFTNNEIESIKTVIDSVKKIPLSQPCEKKKTSCTQEVDIRQICDIPIIFQNCDPLSEKHENHKELQEIVNEVSDPNIKKYFNQVIRTQQDIIRNQGQITRTQTTSNLILRDIKQLVNRLEDVMKSRALLPTKGNDSLIAEILPLRSVQTIKDFETLLRDTEKAVTQFKEFILKVGGNNPRDNIHRALCKIFTNQCAMDCSWKGVRNNFKICDLYFIKIMRRDITLQYSSLTEAEFDNIVAEWLRFAKQRKQREEKGGAQEQDKENN
ncbi:uncharacterized protein LOC114940569 [Nylanderia fulva]|uniref:uncharacterized protein LOC114940569 n=1 Tax=Nylanderia fulva TaxID=613905 RepID=UPI0010FB268A|nr:uncharacterized protein LOC114940569 [Nylanderia fulva]